MRLRSTARNNSRERKERPDKAKKNTVEEKITQSPTVNQPKSWTAQFCFTQASTYEQTDIGASRTWKIRGYCLEHYEACLQKGLKPKHPFNGMRVDAQGKELPMVITEQIRETLLGQCLSEHFQLRAEE